MGWRVEFLHDPAVEKLIRNRSLKPKTLESYLDGIGDFCRFYNMYPSELVEWFREMDEDQVVEAFRNYFIGRKTDLAPKSLWNFTGAVKALLIENDVRTVDRVSREIARAFRRSVGRVKTLLKRDMITKNEIIQILNIAGLREKVLITLMASSGLRIGAALNLKLENIKDNIWDTSLPCYQIEIPETLSKESEPYVTFMSWEAAEYLRDWLKSREQSGETITPSSYLFPSRQGGSISQKRFQVIWRKLCDEAGIDSRPIPIRGKLPRPKKGGGFIYLQAVRYNIRPHSLRKFFRTTLTISGVDPKAAEALMGHSLSKFGVESIYDFAVSNLDYLRSEYLKALNNLLFLRKPRGLEVINGEARKRIEELEAELKRRDEEMEKLRKEVKELSVLLAPMALTINYLAKVGGVELRGLLGAMSDETDKVLRRIIQRRIERGELSEEEAKKIIEAFGTPTKTKRKRKAKTES